ncbi:hypothetical protein I4I83_10190, partial [Acidovorax cattleyae]|nr:hypothetical protein [Paracidovorax cattleyae]
MPPQPPHDSSPSTSLPPGRLIEDPAATPAELGSGWLVIGESPSPEGPLSGDTGKLLDNMLRAMRLHRHPRAHFSAVERAAPRGGGRSGRCRGGAAGRHRHAAPGDGAG